MKRLSFVFAFVLIVLSLAACTHTHQFGEWDLIKKPTCESSGEKVRYCGCGERQTEIVVPTEHSYDAVVTEPSCTQAGYTTYSCVCGDSYVVNNTGDVGHKYQAVVTEPSCTENGYITYTCLFCEDKYVADEMEALGHTHGEGVIVALPTCTENGLRIFTCITCRNTYAEEIVAKHEFGNPVTVAPTCTNDGYTCIPCERCEYYEVIEDSVVPALGHLKGGYTDVIEPTHTICEDGGYRVYACERVVGGKVCGDTTRVRIEPTGHSITVWAYNVAPTFTTLGVIMGSCVTCGAVQTRDLPILNTTDYTYTIDSPNCMSDGMGTYIYNGSERDAGGNAFKYTVILPANNHVVGGLSLTELESKTIGSLTVYVYGQDGLIALEEASSCGEIIDGYFVCDSCGMGVFVYLYSEHAWGKNVTGATCVGGTVKTCTICGFTEVFDDKLPHGYKNTLVYSDADGTFTFNTACVMCDTQNYTVQLTRDEIAVDEPASRPAECSRDGVVRYVYTFIRGEEEISVYCDVVIPKTGKHTLFVNGETVTPNENGYYSSEYIGNGINVLAPDGETSYDFVTCGNTYPGYAFCSCGTSFTVTIYNAHNLVSSPEHQGYVAPSCTTTGVNVFACSKTGCDYYKTEIIDTIMHTFVYKTEEYNKNSELLYRVIGYCACGVCDEVRVGITESEAMVEVVRSTCSASGKKTVAIPGIGVDAIPYVCELPKAPHSVADGVYITDLERIGEAYNYGDGYFTALNISGYACQTVGTFNGYFICTECGGANSVALVANHVFTEYVTILAPTCTEHGTKVATCACGVKDEVIVEPNGHTHFDWMVSVTPTERTMGVLTIYCKDCAVSFEYYIPPLNAEFYTTVENIGDGYVIYTIKDATVEDFANNIPLTLIGDVYFIVEIDR